jgi:hypothetical protein
MEFHGFVRNDETFNLKNTKYAEWIPAKLVGRSPPYKYHPPAGVHWFYVIGKNRRGDTKELTAGKFYLRPSMRSRVSKAKLLLMLEAV